MHRLIPGEAALRGGWLGLAIAAAFVFAILWRTVVHSSHTLWLHAAFLVIGLAVWIGPTWLWMAVVGRLASRDAARTWQVAPAAVSCIALAGLATRLIDPQALWPAACAFAVGGSAGFLVGAVRDAAAGHASRWVIGLALGPAALAAAIVYAFVLPGPTRDDAPAIADFEASLQAEAPQREAGASVATFRYAPEGGDRSSRSVDARALIDDWSGFGGWLREQYFGVDPSALPLSGTVWYPDTATDAPWPVVLIAHGNYPMEIASDDGYAYLCEALAQAGSVCASTDMRFFNTSFLADAFGPMEGDRVARAWILLQHAALFAAWNAEPDHPLAGRLDLDDVSLIGHSRGGAVVVIAATLDRLGRIPEAPSVEVPSGIGIRNVIGLAPIGTHYRPGGEMLSLRDVSYLVLHGARDADIGSFEGAVQYTLAEVSDAPFALKVSLVFAGGNHNYFNTEWSPDDKPLFLSPLIDDRGVLDGEAQRALARAVILRFLSASRGDAENAAWLASRDGLAGAMADFGARRHLDSATRTLVDFDDEAVPRIEALGLDVDVGPVERRWVGAFKGSRAAHIRSADGAGKGWIEIAFESPADLSGDGHLVIDLGLDPYGPLLPEPIGAELALVDAAGSTRAVRLEGIGVDPTIAAAAPYHADLLNPRPELLLETHSVSMKRFRAVEPDFDPTRVVAIRVIPDAPLAAPLVIDRIGWRPESTAD